MKRSIGLINLLFIFLTVFALIGCAPAPTPDPTSTPLSPTVTPMPPTFTPEPTVTATTMPAPVCNPGNVIEGTVNDEIALGLMDITKVSTKLEGTMFTLVMTLREIPNEITINRKELREGQPEIALGVAIDVDNNRATGNAEFNTRSGYGYDVFLQMFKFRTPGDESTGAVEDVFTNWYNLAEATDNGGISFTKTNTTLSVDLERKTITLAADIPNISPESYLYFYSFYQGDPSIIDELCQRSLNTSDIDGMVLVDVPAGEFTMGSGDFVDEQPVHQVYLDTFWIDQTEVTNKMYSMCVNANICELPKSTGTSKYPSYYGNPDFDNYPVVNVNWSMAKDYCEWAGRMLPSEAQWEKAARGADERTYPWGERLSCDKVNYWNGSRSCAISPSPVDSYPNGASPYGVYNMAGNVMEWVSSLYQPYPYAPDDGREDLSSISARVIRGGWWYVDLRSANRTNDVPISFSDNLGFRCALSIP